MNCRRHAMDSTAKQLVGIAAFITLCATNCAVYDSGDLRPVGGTASAGERPTMTFGSTSGRGGMGSGASPMGGVPSASGSNGAEAGGENGNLAGASDLGEGGNGGGSAGQDVGGAGGGSSGNSGTGGGGNGGTSGTSGTGGGGAGPASVELARGKPAKASSVQAGHGAADGNDGDVTTRWCGSGPALPQWWRVDLGKAHALKDLAIRFEYNAETYGYTVETSTDDMVYVVQRTLTGTGAVQKVDLPVGVSARYVRVTVTSVTNNHWACFWELAANGT